MHQQKTFVTLREEGGLSETCDKNLFYRYIIEWSSKNLWKMISVDVKGNKNNKKIKDLVALS